MPHLVEFLTINVLLNFDSPLVGLSVRLYLRMLLGSEVGLVNCHPQRDGTLGGCLSPNGFIMFPCLQAHYCVNGYEW